MSLNISATPKTFELPAAGNHVARCYQVIDLGLQQTQHNGEQRTSPKVRIVWELPELLMEDGRPFTIAATYTLSLHEMSNLRRDLDSWRGRPFSPEELAQFDLFTIIGAAALVNVIHNQVGDKTYANVGSITPLPKSMECPPAVNPTVQFSLDEYDEKVFQSLPDWLRNKINIPTEVADDSRY